MSRIGSVARLGKALEKLAKKAQKESSEAVYVGYTQNYAIFVHERVELKHKKGKSAKFITIPARTKRKEIYNAAKLTMAKTGNFRRAMVAAGLMLQRESMKIVPIDTGALRLSAFTAISSKLKDAVSAAHSKSEKRRMETLQRRASKSKK